MAKVIKLKDNTYLYGTIIEKGSNANGVYEKYSDGRLIQYGTVEATNKNYQSSFGNFKYNGITNWIYPIEFYETPKIVNITMLIEGYLGGCTIADKTNTRTAFYIYTPAAADLTNKAVTAQCIAIGKWK
jgi:hypothetical protein